MRDDAGDDSGSVRLILMWEIKRSPASPDSGGGGFGGA